MAAHSELGHDLARYRVTHLVAVGENEAMEALARSAREQGIKVDVAPDVEAAATLVADILATPPAGEEGWYEREDKDVVLVKASNALGLWAVADRLLSGHSMKGVHSDGDGER